MKKVIVIILLSLLSYICNGQDEGGIKFLGIPVDSTKAFFGEKLKDKGFVYLLNNDSYRGQFNGQTVDVYIHTNHDLVDRIMVSFPVKNQHQVKEDYNELLRQFVSAGKYIDINMNELIPEDESIDKFKHYEADFRYYQSKQELNKYIQSKIRELSEFLTPEQLKKLNSYIKNHETLSEQEYASRQMLMINDMNYIVASRAENAQLDAKKAWKFVAIYEDFLCRMASLADGAVWFEIEDGENKINLYYDNLHNRPHGEDL